MLRKNFPMLNKSINGKPFVYLDSAASTLKPQSVIDSVSHFYAHDYATVNRGVYETCKLATQAYHEVREKVATFIGASSAQEIVFTTGTTQGLNFLAYSLAFSHLQDGDEVIISQMEHHANIVPWQLIKKIRDIQLKVVEIDETGELSLDHLAKLITPKTKVLSLCHVSNTLGTVNPIAKIADMIQGKGITFILDAAQSVPHFPVDVEKLGVDFLLFSGHKIYAPTAVGVLYGKKDRLEALEPVWGGGDIIEEVSFEKTSYVKAPHKFEPGTPMIAQVIGLGEALDFLQRNTNMHEIQKHDQELLGHLEAGLKKINGLSILGSSTHRSGVVSFVVEKAHPLDIATLLDFSGIAIRSGHLCTQPLLKTLGISSCCRASLGLYNTNDEIAFFLKELEAVLKKL